MRVKGTDILKFILLGIGLAGLVVVAVTAPNLFSAFGRLNKLGSFRQQQLKRSFDYTKKSELTAVKKTTGGYLVTLTAKGRERLQRFRLGELHLPKPKKWDGKWRIVMFDIPEKYKLNRLVFARKLKELGLVQMQKSAWVWPYELSDDLDLMKEAYEVRPFVRLVTAQNIDKQTDLINFFRL